MSYNLGQSQGVLYGGWVSDELSYNDVWQWDSIDHEWTKMDAGGLTPEKRSWTACADNGPFQYVLFFGGSVHGQPEPVANNMLSWNGTEWSDLCTGACLSTAPQVRNSAVMVRNSVDFRWYMFGGTVAGEKSNEFWRWGGGKWTRLCASSAYRELMPAPRDKHAMVFDKARNRVVVHGGDDGSGERGDTWEWRVDGLRPYLITSFDLRRGKTVLPNSMDPETKKVREYAVRLDAGGMGYGPNMEPRPGVRLFVNAFGHGPWAPMWEHQNGNILMWQYVQDKTPLSIKPDWSCQEAPLFDPPEGPDGTSNRDYCATASHSTVVDGGGKIHFLLTSRGLNRGDNYAHADLDYIELTVDYYRTGCSAASVDGSACDDGDAATEAETCQSGECIAP